MEAEKKDRRSAPRYKARIACSVLSTSSEGNKLSEDRGPKVLGHTYDLSTEAISIVLSSHPVYGADPTGLGTMAEITLALPVGYVRLCGNFLRHIDSTPQENLFVFMIEGGNIVDRRLYQEYLDSLRRQSVS
jgi:hypothetical protein